MISWGSLYEWVESFPVTEFLLYDELHVLLRIEDHVDMLLQFLRLFPVCVLNQGLCDALEHPMKVALS